MGCGGEGAAGTQAEAHRARPAPQTQARCAPDVLGLSSGGAGARGACGARGSRDGRKRAPPALRERPTSRRNAARTIRSVGDELAQEDLLVRVEGVDDQRLFSGKRIWDDPGERGGRAGVRRRGRASNGPPAPVLPPRRTRASSSNPPQLTSCGVGVHGWAQGGQTEGGGTARVRIAVGHRPRAPTRARPTAQAWVSGGTLGTTYQLRDVRAAGQGERAGRGLEDSRS